MKGIVTSLILAMTSLISMTCHGVHTRHASTHHRSQRNAGSAKPGKTTTYEDPHPQMRYGVLLDAGSSSTKVKVYKYTPAVPPSLVPHVQLEISERVSPGLGDFVGMSLASVEDYLVEVLEHAENNVPERLHAVTPIYVMATAGMRVQPALASKRLLHQSREILSNSSVNPFLFDPDHVSILSGEEEAVYAWLAVNYLRGFFSSDESHPRPAGVLEMGGGSMQVAFLPDTPLLQEEFQVYVGRRRFDLYAQSYLSYGSKYLTDQVRRRLLLQQQEKLAGGGGGEPVVKNMHSPCMLSDDTDKYVSGNATVQVQGTGDATKCEEVLSRLLSPSDSALCSPKPCAIGDTYQPAVGDHPFYAISAFMYAPKTLDAVESSGVMNITKLRYNARKYCDLTVSEAVKKTGTKARFASNDCLMGLYIPLLLTDGLGFDQHTDTITVAKAINGTRIDWALGAMVQLLSTSFMDDPESVVTCRRGDQTMPVPMETIDPSRSSSMTSTTFTLVTLLLVTLLHGQCI